jgi:hypothetical protein
LTESFRVFLPLSFFKHFELSPLKPITGEDPLFHRTDTVGAYLHRH